MKTIQVRVPATSANIGSGFDSSGLALNLYNTFTFDFSRTETLSFENVPDCYANDQHLVIQTFQTCLNEHGIAMPKNLHLIGDTYIPAARGLGSSSSCIVAGLVAANVYGQLNLSQEALCYLASAIEGHPDNVAPAIYGNMVTSIILSNRVVSEMTKIHPQLRMIAIIDEHEVSTEHARKVLPESIPFKVAVDSLSRAAMLPHAFKACDQQLLRTVTQDQLHQPYRFPLIPGFKALEDTLKKDPVLTYWISGSGSTIMVLVLEKELSTVKNTLSSVIPASTQLVICHPDTQGFKVTLL